MSEPVPDLETISKDHTVKQLREFLRERGKPVGGNKDVLVKRVQLFWNDSVVASLNHGAVDPVETDLEVQRKVFDNHATYVDVTKEKVKVPSGYDLEKIFKFLTVLMVSADPSGSEKIDCGTEKPTKKGREMYLSPKITLCEYGFDGNLHLFRANMMASYKRDKDDIR